MSVPATIAAALLATWVALAEFGGTCPSSDQRLEVRRHVSLSRPPCGEQFT